MFKKGEISTEIDQKPFLFTLIALIVGLIVTVLLFVLGGGEPLAVFAGILTAIVTLAAGAVLFALLTDKAYIENKTLYMSYMFKRASIPIEKIGKIALKDEVYRVYDKNGAEVGTINAKLTAIGDVIFALDRSGVNFI